MSFRRASCDFIRIGKTEPGTRLGEVALAERLQVSRTPVRAALEASGPARAGPAGRATGLFRRQREAAGAQGREASDGDGCRAAVPCDRPGSSLGKFPWMCLERDLMQRYDATRPIVQRVLARLSEVAAVQRKPGHGWRFLPTISDPQARGESYRYRMLIEPAGLLEPGFRCEPAWIDDMRRQHEQMLAMPWSDTASIALYEMNAVFHEGLAAGFAAIVTCWSPSSSRTGCGASPTTTGRTATSAWSSIAASILRFSSRSRRETKRPQPT